ncbi:MAG TPA: hypothetical protein VGQ24_10900 [Gemmatimonadales bacterium]|jgi:hypothetical protein|nr:hypothetical protein [Gemmatimonadales bacterium]
MPRLDCLSLLALTLAVPTILSAQTAADSGSFVVRHASDTVAVERFSRTGIKLEGTLSLRNTKKTSERYAAVIGPDATLPLIEVTVREGVDSGPAKGRIVQRARVIFKEDSAAVDEVGEAGLVTRVFGTQEGAIPYLNLSFALLEQAVRRARVTQGASQLAFFNLGGGQTLRGRVSSLGSDSLKLDIGDVHFHLRVDREGRVLGGRIPSQDVVAERQ